MSKDISPPRKLVERKVPSGMNSAWKLWRHCICRNGFYPLLIAPVVTATFLLDVYVSSGCNLMHVEIGIEPTNVAWSKSTLDLGLFSHLSDETNSGSNLLMDTFHPTCKGFDSNFDKYFIDGDKTWKVRDEIFIFFFYIYERLIHSYSKKLRSLKIDDSNNCTRCRMRRLRSNSYYLDDGHYSFTIMLLLARSSPSSSTYRTSRRKCPVFTLRQSSLSSRFVGANRRSSSGTKSRVLYSL